MKTVAGLFDTREQAQQAIQDLSRAGFPQENISILTMGDHQKPVVEHVTDTGPSGTEVGATTGAAIGGLSGLAVGLGLFAIPGIGPVMAAGPIITTLAGLGAGLAVGGLLGALVDLGVPDEQARVYAEGVRRGGTVLVYRAERDEDVQRVADVMARNGAVDIERRADEWRRTGWTGNERDKTMVSSVGEIMTKNPACCVPETNVRDVARMMVDNDTGIIPVVDSFQDKRLAGVVTDRDIVCRLVAEGRNPLQCVARDCWTTGVQTVYANDGVEQCAKMMRQNMIRRIMVVDGSNRLIGVVSQADIAQTAPEEQTGNVVRDVSQPTEEASRLAA